MPVGFGAAIARFHSKYAQFSGRASRSEYWWVALYLFLVHLVLEALTTVAGTDSFGELNALGLVLSWVTPVFSLGNLVPSLEVAVRRLHDVNLSGWMILLGLIPPVGRIAVVVFAILPPKPEGTRFDR